MKIHLITFAHGAGWEGSAQFLRASGLSLGASYFRMYTSQDILSFSTKHSNIFKHSRGYGFYSWKPWILLDYLKNIPEGDAVLYLDAGIQIINSLEPLKNIIQENTRMFFHIGGMKTCVEWTHKECFEHMECASTEYYRAIQVCGGCQMYLKTSENITFLEELLKYCTQLKTIGDNSYTPQMTVFKEHRHDQSILSILIQKYKFKIHRDASQFGDVDYHKGMFINSLGYTTLWNCHRKQAVIPKISVITPTTGAKCLLSCIKSVQKQNYAYVEHIIVVDGPMYSDYVNKMIEENGIQNHDIKVIELPYNIGHGGWNGHRVYGSLPFLVNGEYVSFLDQDNTMNESHIASLLEVILHGNFDWSYSLRNIYNEDKFICKDNCESLGNLHHAIESKDIFHIDTSCFLIKRELAIQHGHAWNVKWIGDRTFYNSLKSQNSNYGCSGKYTLNYECRKQKDPNTPYNNTIQYYLRHNELAKQMYPEYFPWCPQVPTRILYICHFNPEQTEHFIQLPRVCKKSFLYADWTMSVFKNLKENYILKNAYTTEIPENAIVFVTMCDPGSLPAILERKDITRIGYTFESPNIRHQHQWSIQFLKNYFDTILTYWEPLLQYKWAKFVPQMFGFNKEDTTLLKENEIYDKSISIVLARRCFTKDTYKINNTILKPLDHLRAYYASGLAGVTCYGDGWDTQEFNVAPQTPRRSTDNFPIRSELDISIRNKYTFNLIIENCDAEGYVSEKFYDALVAGAIPLYYGNNNGYIPEDMYIDLKKFKNVEEVQTFIDNMSQEDIQKYKDAIYSQREELLLRINGDCAIKHIDNIYESKFPVNLEELD